jgi:hypothetical protein
MEGKIKLRKRKRHESTWVSQPNTRVWKLNKTMKLKYQKTQC